MLSGCPFCGKCGANVSTPGARLRNSVGLAGLAAPLSPCPGSAALCLLIVSHRRRRFCAPKYWPILSPLELNACHKLIRRARPRAWPAQHLAASRPAPLAPRSSAHCLVPLPPRLWPAPQVARARREVCLRPRHQLGRAARYHLLRCRGRRLLRVERLVRWALGRHCCAALRPQGRGPRGMWEGLVALACPRQTRPCRAPLLVRAGRGRQQGRSPGVG